MKSYKKTSCRDKRSIVRALNTFSNKRKFIKCNEKDIDLAKKPITLHYSDGEYEFLYKDKYDSNDTEEHQRKRNEIEQEKNIKNIIYSKEEADMDIRNTDKIIKAIENLISINRKPKIKEKLKEAVKSRVVTNSSNLFLVKENISIGQINAIVDNESFAKKLFSQIKNRVLFYRSGIYSTNEVSATVKKSQIFSIYPTTYNDIVDKSINYISDNLFLLDTKIFEQAKEKKKAVKEMMAQPDFNFDYLDDGNSSSFLFLDNEEESLSNTPEGVHKRKEYMEAWEDYDDVAKNYDFLVDELEASMEEVIFFISKLIPRIEYLNISPEQWSKGTQIEGIELFSSEEKFLILLKENIELLRKCGIVFTQDEFDELYYIRTLVVEGLNIKSFNDFLNMSNRNLYDTCIGISDEEIYQAILFDYNMYPTFLKNLDDKNNLTKIEFEQKMGAFKFTKEESENIKIDRLVEKHEEFMEELAWEEILKQSEIEVSEFEENELEQAVLEWEGMQREVFFDLDKI